MLARDTYSLLKALDGINFIGNIEAREVPNGVCDVLVTDGFAGNIILKHTEGMASTLMGMIKKELLSSAKYKIGAALAKGAFSGLASKFDYTAIGGAPFLGLNGLVVKAHGSSNDIAFCSTIKQSDTFIEKNITGKVEEAMKALTEKEVENE